MATNTYVRAGGVAVALIIAAALLPRLGLSREHDREVRLVVLDSLNGYVNAMPQEDYLYLHLHELLISLNQKGVVTILVH